MHILSSISFKTCRLGSHYVQRTSGLSGRAKFSLRFMRTSLYREKMKSMKNSITEDIISGIKQSVDTSYSRYNITIDEQQQRMIENNISISNKQSTIPINLDLLKFQIFQIQTLLNVERFAIDVMIIGDAKMRKLNSEYRSKSKSTDILSIPACEFDRPGEFADGSIFNNNMHLGDIFLCPSYIVRQILQDSSDYENKKDEYLNIEDAGVSKEMSTKFTLEERLPLFFVHGLLHLLYYDHETPDDWKQMTAKEEEIVQKLKSLHIIN